MDGHKRGRSREVHYDDNKGGKETMKIDEALMQFSSEMKAKFMLRESRNGLASVTRQSVLEVYTHEQIWKRLEDEIHELRTEPTDEIEAVDVANMAFILWWFLKEQLNNGRSP